MTATIKRRPTTPAAPTEWCDRHRGFVDEGRTKPYDAGSRYRICDGCRDELMANAIADSLEEFFDG